MKLILYIGNGLPHKKNYDAIYRMCRVANIEFEETTDLNRLKIEDYNILISCSVFIDPDIIPQSIKIIFGPQFFIFPTGQIVCKQNNELSERCVYNNLSYWIRDLYYEFSTDFLIPLKEFPYSVDTFTFKPSDTPLENEYDCIVYIKRRSTSLINYTLSLLNQKGLKYLTFTYGSYKEEDYKYALQRTKFMLTLDAHESQGFGLEEAMSSGVPLLVMDATSMYDETNDGITPIYQNLKPKNLFATSVPYWSDECGIKITQESELSEAVDKMMTTYKSFTPRDYIVRTLSDEVCMKRILDYFKL